MDNYLHRTTKQYLQSWSPNDLPEPLANYIEEPDLSAVAGVPSKYWIIAGDVVSEIDQAAKDAVDAQILSDSRDVAIQAEIDNLEGVMRQLTKLIVDELNILRQQFNTTTGESGQLSDTAFTDRTLAQVRTQLRNDLGT
jgi:hypothetical protein